MHAPSQYYPPVRPAWLGRFVSGTGAASAALGLLVLAGWYLHWTALIQLRPTLAPMQFNTALCFVLAGIALNVWAWCRKLDAMPVLGGLVAALGGLTLVEYLFHANLGIDQLLFRSYITTEVSHVGRMSPVSAFCFTLAGIALLCLGLRGFRRWQPLIAGSLASIVISITALALAGYAFGLPGTYGWGQLTRIAMHTAAGLCVIGAGLFVIAWNLERRPGERTPRWLPMSLALAVLVGSFVLSAALESEEDQEIAETVRAGAESAKGQVAVGMEARIRAFMRMAQRWEFSGAPSRAAWEDDAANYLHDFPDLQALEWIDASHIVRWIVPMAGNEAKLNLNSTTDERRKAAASQAQRENEPVITRVVALFHGELGFVVYVPIVVKGQFDGFIAGVFDAQTCLRRYLAPAVAADEAIQVSEGGLVIYERDSTRPPVRRDWVVNDKVELHGATWDFRVWPTPELADSLDSSLPLVVLCAGIFGSLLLGGVCFFAQRSSRQATETTRANTLLQAALDNVKTLEGLLPICAGCKRVRDDSGYWNQIDTYLHQHTNASLSHGYCPVCAAKTFKEFGFDVPAEVQAQIDARNFE